MTYSRRVRSETELFHVVARGVGRQIIFEDDDDREWFLAKLSYACRAHRAYVIAYCLMDNHVHLLLHVPNEELSPLMQELLGKYARHFNGRHDHVGHLFQGRFKSEPIGSEEYLLQAVRYIHRNPEVAGIAPVGSYRWSSYREYVGEPRIAETSMVLGMFDSVRDFEQFSSLDGIALAELDDTRSEASSKRSLAVALGEFGDAGLSQIKGLPRDERDAAICRLLDLGISVRQVERMTGVSRSVVQRIGMRRDNSSVS